jgi:flavin reductase (DIM6/NTAB) family NADH-FMN oxidoreductase RutF
VYYQPERGHGLPRDPMTSLVAPRPIAWISTLNEAGLVNLAPFSFYNIVSTQPPAVMFSCSGPKHTGHNAHATGEFVVNVPSYDLRDAMMATAEDVAAGVSEAELAGVEMTPSVSVRPPRVKNSRVALECRYLQTVRLEVNTVVFGRVVGVFIDDTLMVDGFVRWPEDKLLYRLGYLNYGVVGKSFQMGRTKK